jgi:hypothetical protein
MLFVRATWRVARLSNADSITKGWPRRSVAATVFKVKQFLERNFLDENTLGTQFLSRGKEFINMGLLCTFCSIDRCTIKSEV